MFHSIDLVAASTLVTDHIFSALMLFVALALVIVFID